ncbi:LOW QUALITY PROTEIN: lipoxygenase homology domain-containing protein 1-like [Haliotis rubra]|uniref:LOW QUALITY PROTEIN: lipoxygenase homology domain-containing protein 1-like n=1 Tax=Haliotis rubra TaxID=36100 RepID=UPI001EE5FA51|nr:LOW QUALITY PROTEIN: lipoxygenase homology domain-containing protein 1-like [Haliotis rubra]
MGDHHFIHDDSNDSFGPKGSLDPVRAKTCYFYKDQDYKFGAVKVAVNEKSYRKFDVLLTELCRRVPGLNYGVRGVFTPRGRHSLKSIGDLRDGGHYVCSTKRRFAKGLDLEQVHSPELWHLSPKPKSGIREYNNILQEVDVEEGRPVRQRRMRMAYGANANRGPKKVTVMKNRDPSFRHIMLLNRRTSQTFDQVLSDLSDMFKFAVRKLFTIDGRRITGLSQILKGPDVFVAAGKEPFKSMLTLMYNAPHPPSERGPSHRLRSRNPTRDHIGSRVRERRDRLIRTKGRWKVWLMTNELGSAGTDAQVTLTVYGKKANSGPIPLGYADDQHFQSGQIDEFDISVGSIGEIYKIRIAHDNTGSHPGWFCDEVRMKDIDTGEELVFPCKKWLARDEDDHETCRELPVTRPGDPHLPLLKYEVDVTTGNLWNAGTDANVYLTIYGDRGDTGVRQLYTENRQRSFNKGQTDSFEVEAVSLGHLKRVIVGHDATGPGSGWFLERLVIKDPTSKQQIFTFHCNKWLDEGEDDGKIVRELRVQNDYTDDILEKRNWEFEKWKFENRNQVMYFSHSTGKALRIKLDGTVDGLGEPKDQTGVFSVLKKKNMVAVFSSQTNPNFHLAIENGRLLGHGKGGSLCEFKVRVQSDQSVILEALKNPLQFVTIGSNGRPGEVRGILDYDPNQKFSVFCKGMFRERGIVLFRTSPTQAINVDQDKTVFGTGKCNRAAHFRVHKVSEGIRMFESMIYPGNFLRFKDGKIDCSGRKDDLCQFIVAKHHDKGYVTLQSAISRGLYVGLTTQGRIHPTVDTGVQNIWLYPEVVEFGVPKQRGGASHRTPRESSRERDRHSPRGSSRERGRRSRGSSRERGRHSRGSSRERGRRSPRGSSRERRPRSPRAEIEDGDWKIIVSSSESLENGEVAIVAYGDRGCSGAIILAGPAQNGTLFQTGSNDEFKSNFHKCGKLYKIRLELIPKNPTKAPSWKVREVKMQDLKSKEMLKFQFNRWLSRRQDDEEIMREMPVVRPGENVLPVLSYVVEVMTGTERNASTDADVHLTIFGERGDSGKRVLRLSNNRNKFKAGQTDSFEVEAVHLGKLNKVHIGHNATGAGDGWHLDKVIIKESESSRDQYIFPCDRWFDSSLEDRRIERTLHVKEPAPSKIVTAMRRESSEYASQVVAAALEAATRNLQFGDIRRDSRQSDFNDTEPSVVYEDESFELEKIENDIIDEDTDNSEVSEHGGVQLERVAQDRDDGNDTDHSVVSEADNDDEAPARHAQNDSDPDGEAEEKKVTATKKKEESNKPGDWTVWLTTGKKDGIVTKDEVVMYVYGSSGHVGPISLGKGEQDYFKSGNTDQFKVHFQSKLGHLYKIRVGLSEIEPDSRWYLEKVRMMDMTSKEELNFKVNRWLSRTEDDHDVWRELPVTSKNQRPLPVHVYQVEVFTGSGEGADTDANVSITIYGESGDTGKRKLYMSKSNKQGFQRGKIDVFDVEAVSLGELEKLIIGHDGIRAGNGWYLEKVVVKESSGVDSRQFFFPCDRWLDSGKEDKKIERELVVADPPSVSQGDFKLLVKTASDSKAANGSKVSIAFYGSTGNSEDIALYAPSSQAKLFEPGNMDEFEVSVGDIGELYKVRISRDDSEEWKGWHLQDITLQDKHTKDEHVFKFDRWLGRGMDDSDLTREIAIVRGGKPVDKVYHYTLTVHTGDHWAGETDAEIYMTLYGSHGDTGRRRLYVNPADGPKFRKGKTDAFEFEAVDLGELRNLVIGHSSQGHGAGWFLDKVEVMEKGGSRPSVQHVFPCYQWLDSGEGDGATERTLNLIDTVDTRKKSPAKKSGKNNGVYDVIVKTSNEEEAGTKSHVSVTLCGKNGDSKPQQVPDPKGDVLYPGREGKFQINAGNIGDLMKIRLEHEAASASPTWKCDYVKVSNSSTGEELMLYVDRWFAEEKDDGQTVREIAVTGRPSQMPLPALQYVVMIQTGRGRGDGCPGAQVAVNLYGVHGNTGLRPLTGSLNGVTSMWNDGHLDVFVVSAVSVGKLQQVQLKFTGKGRDNDWTVDHVTVMDSVSAAFESVCRCNQTLRDDGKGTLKSLPVSETQISTGVPEDIAFRIRDKREPESRGKWTGLVYTGGQSDAGTKDKVMMVIYGTSGHTEPKQINKTAHSVQGPVLKCSSSSLNVGKIGQMFKVRIFFDSKAGNSSWFLEKMKLKDANSGEEFNLEYRDWVRSSTDNPDGTIELPTIRPDMAPLQDTVYQVAVVTGDLPVAETDAEVFCTVIGQWGDTGERVLALPQSKKKPFRQGKRDEFEIRTLDLGVISKLLIGHNEIGRGAGWHCERVSIGSQSKRAGDLWMDSGCEDRRLVRELTPFAHLQPGPEITPAQRSKSKGVWTCFVTMATEDKLDMSQTDFSKPRPVTMFVYGSRSVEGALELTNGKKTHLMPGQTHKFAGIKLGNIGDIEKVRVTLGEEKEEKPVWTIQQVTLTDAETGESLTFNFDSWVGEVNGDISKELPLIKPGQTFPPLIDYRVVVYTSNMKNAGTQSDVFLNMYSKGRDCGRRLLLRNNLNKSTKFQEGQVDAFIVSAVDLGEIDRVKVTKGPGNPWHLDKIIIKAGPFDNTQRVFDADRWLGSDRSKSLEVDETLTLSGTRPRAVALPPESADDLPVSRGQWKIEAVTGEGGTRGNVSDLVVVLGGERGESSLLSLKSSRSKPFQPRQTDLCQVKLAEDIGEMTKVRIGFRDNDREKAWNLKEIRFEDEDTRDCFSYNLDSWVAVDDNQDGWREFPVVWPAVKILPVVKYQVSVHLGDVPKPGSGLQLYVEIFGEAGSTGHRSLKRSLNNAKTFQPNQTDEFQIEAVSVLDIERVIVGHSYREKGRGVYLKKVVVKETTETNREYVFVCNRWLDQGQDDHAIERALVPHSGPVVDAPPRAASRSKEKTPSPKPHSPTGDPWTVWTTTGANREDGTGNAVTLVLYGDKGHSEPIIIGEQDDFEFRPGSKDKFDVRVSRDVGEVYKVRLAFDGAADRQQKWYSDFSSCPSWLPDTVVVMNNKTRKEYMFESRKWVRVTDYEDCVLELPVYNKDEDKMLQVYKYHVEVFTGDVKYAGTDANVYIQIYGDRGDTGTRHLHGSYTNANKFEQGNCDLFEIEAVELGKLKKVKVSHDGYDAGSGWFLDKVVIEVPQEGNDKYVFKCARWLDEGQDDKALERVLPMSETIKAKKPKAGDWQVLVTTGDEDDSATDARVFLTVYGDRGRSDEERLQGHFHVSRTDHFDIWLDPNKIGKIRKIRLRHDDSGMAAGWRVKQVVLIDRVRDERLEFPINRWLSFSENHGDIAVEVPAHWPKKTPEAVYKYVVQTTTATDWGSGTDASVYINLFGSKGDSGKRFLRNSLEDKNKFETGSVDTFQLEAVDLGRLEKVVVGHDGSGAGAGWKLDSVTVKINNKEQFVFPYGKWIDEDKDDQLTEVEIPVSKSHRGGR